MESPFELLSPGQTLRGRYEIVRCLGAGGMGVVYEVLDLETLRHRALKTMLPGMLSDPDLRDRFHLEAIVAGEIESEHIVEVLDVGLDEKTGLPFLVMELLRGETLTELLRRRAHLESHEVVQLLYQASLGLERTHAAGIVHRDLKPENLFLTTRDDGSLRLKLLDFGIAKVAATKAQASTTRNLGSPLYMAPEQIRGDGDVGLHADLYSLGQLAFTLLVGQPYWHGESQQAGGPYRVLLRVMEGGREPASVRAQRHAVTLPPAFDAWFQRATARQPQDRFEHAAQLVQALALALAVEPPRPHSPQSSLRPVRARGPRGRAGFALAAALVLSALAVLAARTALRSSTELPPREPPGVAHATPPAASLPAGVSAPMSPTTASGPGLPRPELVASSRKSSVRAQKTSGRAAPPGEAAARPPKPPELSIPQDPTDVRR